MASFAARRGQTGTTRLRGWRSGALALLLLLLPAAAHAGTWTLDRVLEAMRRRDPVLRGARAEGRANRVTAVPSWFAWSPRLSLHAGATRSDDPALLFSEKLRQGRFTASDFAPGALNQPPAETAIEWGVSVEQPLFNGAEEVTAPRLASHLRRAASAGEDAAVAARLFYGVEVFVEALRARRAATADSIGCAAADEGARAAAERFRRGQVPELDTLRAAARRAETRAAWLESGKQYAVATARLSALVGDSVRGEELAEVTGAATAGPAPRPAGGRGESRAARAIAAARGIESLQAQLRLLPAINARLSLDRFRRAGGGSFEPRWTAAVAVELPLWDGTRRWSEWRAARARADQAAAEAEALDRDLAVTALDAEAEIGIAGERAEAARLGRAAADEALRLALDRYRAGLLPAGEWLDADAEAERARTRHADAEARLALASYRYLHAIGALR